MKTANRQVSISFSQTFATPECKRQKSTQNKAESRLGKLLRKAHGLLYSFTATVITATIFLGCSYLFFIQLAEYGW